MNTAKSVNGVMIRLPAERWVHITEEHAEMAGYTPNGQVFNFSKHRKRQKTPASSAILAFPKVRFLAVWSISNYN